MISGKYLLYKNNYINPRFQSWEFGQKQTTVLTVSPRESPLDNGFLIFRQPISVVVLIHKPNIRFSEGILWIAKNVILEMAKALNRKL